MLEFLQAEVWMHPTQLHRLIWGNGPMFAHEFAQSPTNSVETCQSRVHFYIPPLPVVSLQCVCPSGSFLVSLYRRFSGQTHGSAGPQTLALGFGKAYLESGLCPEPQTTLLHSKPK